MAHEKEEEKYGVQCCFDEINTIAIYIFMYCSYNMWSVLEEPYMPSTIYNEYIHTIDQIPYSKCAQEILGKILERIKS